MTTKEKLLAILEEDDLVPSAEVARLLGVSSAAVSNYKKRHSDFPLPIIEIWNLHLFSKTQVLEWEAKREVANTYGGKRVPKVTTILQLIGRLSPEDRQKVKDAL